MFYKNYRQFVKKRRRRRQYIIDDLSDMYLKLKTDDGNRAVRKDPLNFELEQEQQISFFKDRSYVQRASIDERLDPLDRDLVYKSDDNQLLKSAHSDMWREYRRKRWKEAQERRGQAVAVVSKAKEKPEFTAENLQRIAGLGITKLQKVAKFFRIGTEELRDLIKEAPEIAEVMYSSKEAAHIDLNQRLMRIAMGEEKASKAEVEAMTYMLKTVFKQNEQEDYLKRKLKLQQEEIALDKAKLHFQQLSTAAKVSHEWSDDKVTEFLEKTAKLNESILGKAKPKKEESELE